MMLVADFKGQPTDHDMKLVDGVIFGDGVPADTVSFCSRAVATISMADRHLNLVGA